MKTPAERIAAILREHANGPHEPDGPLARALSGEMRKALGDQRKACSEAVNRLYKTVGLDSVALYAAYSAVLETPIIGEKP